MAVMMVLRDCEDGGGVQAGEQALALCGYCRRVLEASVGSSCLVLHKLSALMHHKLSTLMHRGK